MKTAQVKRQTLPASKARTNDSKAGQVDVEMDEVCCKHEVKKHRDCRNAIVVVGEAAVELAMLTAVGDPSVVDIEAVQERLHSHHAHQE